MLNFRSDTMNSAVHATGVRYSAICLISSVTTSNSPKIACEEGISSAALVRSEKLDLLCINWISRSRRLTSTKIPHIQNTHISGFEDPCAVALCIDLVKVPQSDQCTTSDILYNVNLRRKANKAR
jgi:hypothetical protein